MNVTRDDIVGMSDFTDEEIAAIAEHEDISDSAAAILGQYLLDEEHDPNAIRAMIKDDIRAALDRGDRAHAAALFAALHHFVATHHVAKK
ncbi:hypothetical protein [Chthonobacter rhizosphaerae]|uniref:hypothetical protein n=1 Tax=Chthonobacter rhizosphaerae TaxID=2735553 RepID=UPI0015EE6007|nr:hypothetical protein [Chthonobacter rhizosphaerae]